MRCVWCSQLHARSPLQGAGLSNVEQGGWCRVDGADEARANALLSMNEKGCLGKSECERGRAPPRGDCR